MKQDITPNTRLLLQPSRLSGIILVILASACWSTSGIFIKIIIQKSGISTVGLAFWRELITALVLLAGILVFNPRLLYVKIKDIPWLIGMGVISIAAFHILWNTSVMLLGASLATVIHNNAPIIVTILARFMFGEQITIRKVAAICLAIIGTILVAGFITGGDWTIKPQSLLIGLSSAAFFATFSLFGKKLSQNYSIWTIMFYIFAIGGLTLFLYQFGKPAPWPVGSDILIWFLLLLLVSTILGFAVYIKGLKYIPASIASITATSEILFASTLAYFILGEQLTIGQVLGAVLIVCGVVLVSLENNTHRTPSTGQ